MQTLRDAATLAVLILLALTLRVDFDGKPVELDLNPPAVASMSDQPQPARTAVKAESTPAQAAPKQQPIASEPLQAPRREAELRRFVWEIDGKRVVIVLGGESPTPQAAASEPCDSFDPRLSC